MPRLTVQYGNIREFSASFHDTSCAGCSNEILEGHPCGQLLPDTDIYCLDCINVYGQKATIKLSKLTLVPPSSPLERENPRYDYNHPCWVR